MKTFLLTLGLLGLALLAWLAGRLLRARRQPTLRAALRSLGLAHAESGAEGVYRGEVAGRFLRVEVEEVESDGALLGAHDVRVFASIRPPLPEGVSLTSAGRPSGAIARAVEEEAEPTGIERLDAAAIVRGEDVGAKLRRLGEARVEALIDLVERRGEDLVHLEGEAARLEMRLVARSGENLSDRIRAFVRDLERLELPEGAREGGTGPTP